jgi:hypothetical protein
MCQMSQNAHRPESGSSIVADHEATAADVALHGARAHDRLMASAKLEMLAARVSYRRAAQNAHTRISLGEIVDGLGQTGIGLTLLLLTLPALIPIPGPFGLVFGSILAFVSLQLMFGARRLWLPAWAHRRGMSIAAFDALIARGVPLLRRIETWLTPRRWLPLTGRLGRMALALPLLTMAIALALPIPLGNVPPAASLITLSLGLIVRDGVAIVVGLCLAIAALIWMAVLLTFGTKIFTTISQVLGWT